MLKQNNRLDFGDNISPRTDFALFEKIIIDRGSRYAVSFGFVQNQTDVKSFLTKLKNRKKFAKATHNSWATRISHQGAVYETKSDDGEEGAGMIILRTLQKHNVTNCIVCVTRWFGGTMLHADRFKHVQTATNYAVDNIKWGRYPPEP